MKITALTYNFIGIPLFSKKYFRRMHFFIEELKKLQPDIFCLQEIWLNSAKMKIISELKPFGYHFFYPYLRNKFCGLLTGGKGEAIERNYMAINPVIGGLDRSIVEFFGSKGYAFAEFEIKGKKIEIFNVHLNCNLKAKEELGSGYYDIQEKAVDSMICRINKLENRKIIILGDFNFGSDSPLYQKIMNIGGISDIVPTSFNTFMGNVLRFSSDSQGKPDHIFIKNISESEVLKTDLMWEKDIPRVGRLSDHAGILATINI